MTGRCVATNVFGVGCVLPSTHGTDGHLYADDPSYCLGVLRATVKAYLAGDADRDALASALAETAG